MTKQNLLKHSTGRSSKSRRFKWAIIVLSFVIVGSVLFLRYWPSFGGTISGERLKRAQASPHYHDGKFANTLAHPALESGDVWDYLKEQFFGDQMRVPPSAIPMSAISPASMKTQPPPGLRSIWLGHSSVYIELDGLRLLLDPVFSNYASPFSGIGPKRFHAPPIAMTDLPTIDAVIISHDHYDHLDMRTIQYLSSKGTHFFVPLGVGSHLDEWEVPKRQITELDWWESTEIKGLTIVCTPAQHYSSRGIFDYKETLWSSWSVIGPKHRVFYSGDTGFASHFQQIGNRLGPFDLGIIKIGQYGPGASWSYSHMDPEQAIEAHLAVRARRMLPVSWGTFNAAFHNWDEPIKRAVKAADEKNVELVTPRVGEVVIAGKHFNSYSWWEEVR
jgi:L-ascorbate metabolism protein UlaG (beta-lactamase superfamily)